MPSQNMNMETLVIQRNQFLFVLPHMNTRTAATGTKRFASAQRNMDMMTVVMRLLQPWPVTRNTNMEITVLSKNLI